MNMHSLLPEIAEAIQGEVRSDIITRKAYSVDASIYEIEPIGIVLPKCSEDILRTIKLAAAHNVPVIARGAATGITGGCLGKGLIIDTSKYLHQILEINYEQEYAICQPGVVQDQLNAALSAQGYRLGPDTSTGNRATLGGMLANNSAGARSLKYGKMVDHVLEVELTLSSGEMIRLQALDQSTLADKLSLKNSEGRIYREVMAIKDQYAPFIEKHFPKIPRRVSGYNLDELLKDQPLNLSKLVAGSEGTLGIATQIKMRISARPKAVSLCIIHFTDLLESMHAIEAISETQPMALEMIDQFILDSAKKSPSLRHKLSWLQQHPACLFIAEYEGASPEEALSKARHLQQLCSRTRIGYACTVLNDPQEIAHVWEVRKAGLGLLLSKRTYSRAIAFIEDLTLPPQKLPDFMQKFLAYLHQQGKQAGIYGHVGSGCMHIRPYMNLRKEHDIHLMQQMMLDVSDMIKEVGGALSGEHGDGLIRSWLNKKMFGEDIYQAFTRLKNAFDPSNLMNPNKIVEGPSPVENLRPSKGHPVSIPTFLDFSPEGGFDLSADLCNGNGSCRKKEGIMCPSFQATNDELHTTRARAQALRSIVNGKLPLASIASAEVLEVLDLCLECKGCKTECPSQVDMAKMKSEILFQHQEIHGYSWRNYLFAHVPNFNKIGSFFPFLYNKISQSSLSQYLRDKVGISIQRPLPALASSTFSKIFKSYKQQGPLDKTAVLFIDTFTEFHDPHIGLSALKVLNKMGYKVVHIPWSCCGRPLISKGFLKEARKKANALIHRLSPYAEQNIPIIGLEPSCIMTIRDDFLSLVELNKDLRLKIQKIAAASTTFDEFIAEHLDLLSPHFLPACVPPKQILLHVHCHQKALVGCQAALKALQAIPGCHITEIKSGCCGMAGSFGYEKEHVNLSTAIANLKLIPAIQNNPDSIVVANGISCRSQISHLTEAVPLHIAECLANNTGL